MSWARLKRERNWGEGIEKGYASQLNQLRVMSGCSAAHSRDAVGSARGPTPRETRTMPTPRTLRRTATAAGAKPRPYPYPHPYSHPHPHRGALTRAAGVSRGGKRGRAAETVSGRRRRRGRWKKTPWGSEGQRPGRWDRDQPQAQQQQQGAGCRHGAGGGWKGRRGGQRGGCSHTRSGAMNNHVKSGFF